MMFVPLVSAKGDGEKSGSRPAADATYREYIVSPSTDNSLIAVNSVYSLLSATYIKSGQTVPYSVNVGPRVKYLEVDLNWGDKSDKVTLSITPPYSKLLGTYSDSSDGSVNGRIHLNIYPTFWFKHNGLVFSKKVSWT